jgi:RNA polymerase sigma-70 factor (ECF subfamily)
LAANYIDINKAIVDRCRNGDNKAQYELYHLYAKQMYNVCVRIVNNNRDAEDILQDSFLEAFKGINDFRGESSFGAWLKTIVVNRSINFLNKKKLLLFDNIHGAESLQYEETNTNADDIQYEVKKVNQALLELPEGYRVVLSLYLIEGYDHAEIAQILNITESTSKSQFNRAKEKLRQRLKEKYYAG